MDKKTRWHQRFKHLENAFQFLQQGLKQKTLTPLEEAGIIQTFEFTFELSWKTLKDFLESRGTIAPFPRDVLKEAFAVQLLHDSKTWLEMLDKRNLLSHTYNREQATKAVDLIKHRYYPVLEQVYLELKKQCSD
jgi:nucleotidyltransferase substrate binding protein (TIGR01987 family)